MNTKLSAIKEAVSKAVAKTKFTCKKYSPEILLGVSIASTVASFVLTIRASEKHVEQKADFDSAIAEIDRLKGTESYDKEQEVKDTGTAIGIYIGQTMKTYALPAALLGVGFACSIKGNRISANRYAGLAAAYAALQEQFKQYKNTVTTVVGEEKAQEIESKYKEVPDVQLDCFTYEWNRDTVGSKWKDAPYVNEMFIKAQETAANNILNADGYIFLSDVLELLGLPVTKASRVIGWRKYTNEQFPGDGYVSFGLEYLGKEFWERVNTGECQSITLEFNVDGEIWSSFEEYTGRK